MKAKFLMVVALMVGVLFVSGAALAHHGNVGYDSGKVLKQKGVVTQWIWSNPHCLLRYDVKGDDGQVVHWIAETQAPVNMVAGGWRPQSMKPGDEITITIEPMKDGRPAGRIETILLPNGQTLIGQTQTTLKQKDESEGHK